MRSGDDAPGRGRCRHASLRPEPELRGRSAGNPIPRTNPDFTGFPPPPCEIQFPAPRHAHPSDPRQPRGSPRQGPVPRPRQLKPRPGPGYLERTAFAIPRNDNTVLQRRVDRRLNCTSQSRLARSHSKLRAEVVLILGRGNIVHNMRASLAACKPHTPRLPRGPPNSTRS